MPGKLAIAAGTDGDRTRAAVLLANAARARAALDGRDYVVPDDVKALATQVLRHRLLLSPAAEIEGKQVEALVADLFILRPTAMWLINLHARLQGPDKPAI